MRNKMVRELIIIFLLLLIIVFAMGILFYDSMAEDVEDIIATQYTSSDEVNKVLAEIEENGGENLKPDKTDSLLKSYSIDAEDLSRYASENYYESGKKDPFAENSETIDEHTITTVQTGTATQSQTSNSIKNTNVINNTNTINLKEKTDTIGSNTILNSTNTVKNTVTTNTVNKVSNDKNESSSTKGTFFEDKNSK